MSSRLLAITEWLSVLALRRGSLHVLVLGIAAVVVAGAVVLREGPPRVTDLAHADPDAPSSGDPADAAATQYFAQPLPFLKAPVAVEAVKNEAVIPRAAAASPAAAAVRPRAAVSVGANGAESLPAQPAPSPSTAVARGLLSPGSSAAPAFNDPSQPVVTPSPTPAPTPSPEPVLLRMHTVRPGETLNSIGRQYGVSVESLLTNNLLIQNGDSLKIGLQLAVPGVEGVLYFVNYGDTLSEIAARHGVEMAAIVNYKPNELADANALRDGQLILVPGGRRPRPAPPPRPEPTPSPAPTLAPAPIPALAPNRTPGPVLATPRPSGTVATAPAPTARPATSGFIWPITGPISSYFGPRHPLGIDIDLYGRAGTPIVASRGGTVAFAGGNACCSYGFYVDIDHGDGYKTRYAHFQGSPPVRIGQRVEQGQVIGYAGSTGYSTGVHLHFEVMRNGAPVNPMGLLP